MNESIEYAMARVTEHGLLFNETMYSSPKMIQEDWFIKARVFGEWEIPVLINKENLYDIVVVSLDPAINIEKPIELDEVIQQVYYEAMQNLKAELYHFRKMSKKTKK